MDELLRVHERMSTAENPLGANPEANRNPFDILNGKTMEQNLPTPGGMPPSASGVPSGGFAGLSKEEVEQLMGGASPEEMAQWSPEQLDEYLKRYEKLITKNRSEQMNKSMLGKIDSEGAAVVEPVPGFVLKTAYRQGAPNLIQGSGANQKSNAQTKLFINICSHEMVEKPHMQSLMAEQTGSAEEEQGLRIPVSVGPPIEDFDKKKEACIVIDVLVHPMVVENCEKEAESKLMVQEFAINAIQQKYKCALDTQNVKYPKIKYKGPLQYQRIRVTKKSQIQEEGSSSSGVGGDGDAVTENNKPKEKVEVIERPEFEVWYYAREEDIDEETNRSMEIEQDDTTSTTTSKKTRLNGFDLPCYNTKESFAENFRKKQGWVKNEEDSETATGEKMLEQLLQTQFPFFVCRIFLPKLKRWNIAKQCYLTISDEGFRLMFLSKEAKYMPLVMWFPLAKGFCSSQAVCEWDAGEKVMEIRIPVVQPELVNEEGSSLLDDDLLNEIF
ncbi:unnamed protein product [Amoebophrya sp. A120]|nr:unnamed protein product [Amoebophrya sp. A120]|eukprot:GSA120T00010195001.1